MPPNKESILTDDPLEMRLTSVAAGVSSLASATSSGVSSGTSPVSSASPLSSASPTAGVHSTECSLDPLNSPEPLEPDTDSGITSATTTLSESSTTIPAIDIDDNASNTEVKYDGGDNNFLNKDEDFWSTKPDAWRPVSPNTTETGAVAAGDEPIPLPPPPGIMAPLTEVSSWEYREPSSDDIISATLSSLATCDQITTIETIGLLYSSIQERNMFTSHSSIDANDFLVILARHWPHILTEMFMDLTGTYDVATAQSIKIYKLCDMLQNHSLMFSISERSTSPPCISDVNDNSESDTGNLSSSGTLLSLSEDVRNSWTMDLTIERALSDALAIVLIEVIKNIKRTSGEKSVKCDSTLIKMLTWKHPFLVHRIIKKQKSASKLSSQTEESDSVEDLRRFVETHASVFDFHSSSDLPFSDCDPSEMYISLKSDMESIESGNKMDSTELPALSVWDVTPYLDPNESNNEKQENPPSLSDSTPTNASFTNNSQEILERNTSFRKRTNPWHNTQTDSLVAQDSEDDEDKTTGASHDTINHPLDLSKEVPRIASITTPTSTTTTTSVSCSAFTTQTTDKCPIKPVSHVSTSTSNKNPLVPVTPYLLSHHVTSKAKLPEPLKMNGSSLCCDSNDMPVDLSNSLKPSKIDIT